jgi:hypothetical protein
MWLESTTQSQSFAEDPKVIELDSKVEEIEIVGNILEASRKDGLNINAPNFMGEIYKSNSSEFQPSNLSYSISRAPSSPSSYSEYGDSRFSSTLM